MANKTKNSGKMTVNQQMKLVLNAIAERSTWLRQWLDKEGKDINAECGYPDQITIDNYKNVYRRGDIAARLVEIYPNECWQDPPDVYEVEDNEETAFEKAWIAEAARMSFNSILFRIDVLSGIGRYGVLLIGINDGKTLDKPVAGVEEALMAEFNAAQGKTPVAAPTPAADATTPTNKPTLIYLRTFDESVVTIKSIETNQASPRFGQPLIYTLKFQDPNQIGGASNNGVISTIDTDVHWTRILHVCDNRTDSDIFGMPRLERIYNRLLDLRKTLGGSGEMFWRGGFPGLSIETQPINSDEAIDFDPEATKKEIEQYQRGMKRYLALVGMTAKSLQPQIADPTNHMNAQIRMIAIAWGIPWRILMGAELGQLASEQDIKAWNSRVRRRQNDYVTPFIIIPFAKRLIAMGVLPAPAEGKSVQVSWSDVHTVTEMDKSTVAMNLTNAITKYVQGGGEMIVDPFHFLTLVLKLTDDEANSILLQVGDALEQDRLMKQEMAQAALDGTKADAAATQAAANNGGAGNGNANGSTSASRNTNLNRAPQGAAA